MGLFKKNAVQNEAQYPTVVKNGGTAGLLIWRYPLETFKVNTTLIVMPGEQAIFIKNGEIYQVFGNGSYSLSPEKYSFIRRLLNKLTGKVETFSCVVYFVNAADTRELLWGTQTPIQVRDAVYGIRTDVKARGAYKIRITVPEVFLKKLVGSNVNYQDDEAFEDYFANEFQGKIKASVSRLLNSLDKELIGIDEYADDLSEQIKPRISDVLSEYGLECVSFSISGLDVDVSKYDVMDESQMAAVATVKKARGDRSAMDILGSDWEKQQSADLLHGMVDRLPSDGLGAIGVGLGVGSAAGGMFEALSRKLVPEATPNQSETHGQESNSVDPIEWALVKLKKLFDDGLITESEYMAKKAELLGRM